jgi:hypothetical protein
MTGDFDSNRQCVYSIPPRQLLHLCQTTCAGDFSPIRFHPSQVPTLKPRPVISDVRLAHMYPVISNQPLSAFAWATACAGCSQERAVAKAMLMAVATEVVRAVVKAVQPVVQSVKWIAMVASVERSTAIGRSAFSSIKATDVENTNATNRSVRRVQSNESSAFTEPSITPRSTVPNESLNESLNESVREFSQAPPLRR